MKRGIGFILCLGAFSFFSGCSVIMPITSESEKEYEVIQVDGHRLDVIGELGEPVDSIVIAGGYREDTYRFKDGYPIWSNVLRSVSWAAADFFTIFLWEIVGTPLETYAFKPSDMTAEVCYDGKRVVWGAIYDKQRHKVYEVGRKPEPGVATTRQN